MPHHGGWCHDTGGAEVMPVAIWSRRMARSEREARTRPDPLNAA